MDMEVMNSYLTNIEENIFDEKKIVSYSWLSRTLGIHSNLSKQLLHTFFENNPKKDELSATYILIGFPNNEDNVKVMLVDDKSLCEVEKGFQLITSKHIYSIQKCSKIPDLNVLYTAQKEESIESLLKGISAIDFNCNERDGTLIAKLKTAALPTSDVKKVTTQLPTKRKSPAKSLSSEKDNKSENKGSENGPEVKKPTIPTMFKNNAATQKKPAGKANEKNKKQGGIGAFFNKAAATNKEVASKPANLSESVKNKGANEPAPKEIHISSPLKENKATLNIKQSPPKSEALNIKESPPKPKEETHVKSKAEKAKPQKASKKAANKKGKASAKKSKPVEKTRKRLMVFSDSDSNDSEVGEDEEEEIQREPTPEPQPAMIVDDDDDMISATPEPSKKRKRKLVSRTFKSSDGFMCTEKHYVSCSEEEEEMPEKKMKESETKNDKSNSLTSDSNSTKNSPKEKKKETLPSPQKTKQASLMSFFKKK